MLQIRIAQLIGGKSAAAIEAKIATTETRRKDLQRRSDELVKEHRRLEGALGRAVADGDEREAAAIRKAQRDVQDGQEGTAQALATLQSDLTALQEQLKGARRGDAQKELETALQRYDSAAIEADAAIRSAWLELGRCMAECEAAAEDVRNAETSLSHSTGKTLHMSALESGKGTRGLALRVRFTLERLAEYIENKPAGVSIPDPQPRTEGNIAKRSNSVSEAAQRLKTGRF